LRIWRNDALIGEASVRSNGFFELRLPLRVGRVGPVSFRIEALQTFVPASCAAHSFKARLSAFAGSLGLIDAPSPTLDRRELAFRVESVQVV
jgi:hypothetical protein